MFYDLGVMTKNKTLKKKNMCSEESLYSVPEAFSSCLFVSGSFPWMAVLAPPWLSRSYPSPSSFPLCVAKSGFHLALLVGSLSHSLLQPLHFLPFRERCSSREAWPYSCTCVRYKQKEHGSTYEDKYQSK